MDSISLGRLKELDMTERLSLLQFSLKGNLKYVKSRIS